MTDRPEGDEPIVRDRRRIDPVTGAVRANRSGDSVAGPGVTPGPAEEPDLVESGFAAEVAGAEALMAELQKTQDEAAERLDDLRRLQAEYVNYRRRVERDREVVRDTAVAQALAELLPVLDNIDRARDHGDLTGAFKAVGEELEQRVAKLGLEKFGAEGDPFDPTMHEALMHEYSDEVTEPSCVKVLMSGYRYGERIVRPARVAVAEPTAALPEPTSSDEAGQTGDEPAGDQAD